MTQQTTCLPRRPSPWAVPERDDRRAAGSPLDALAQVLVAEHPGGEGAGPDPAALLPRLQVALRAGVRDLLALRLLEHRGQATAPALPVARAQVHPAALRQPLPLRGGV